MQSRSVQVVAEIQERLSASGAYPVATTPGQFGAYITSEAARWDRVVKQAKLLPVQYVSFTAGSSSEPRPGP